MCAFRAVCSLKARPFGRCSCEHGRVCARAGAQVCAHASSCFTEVATRLWSSRGSGMAVPRRRQTARATRGRRRGRAAARQGKAKILASQPAERVMAVRKDRTWCDRSLQEQGNRGRSYGYYTEGSLPATRMTAALNKFEGGKVAAYLFKAGQTGAAPGQVGAGTSRCYAGRAATSE